MMATATHCSLGHQMGDASSDLWESTPLFGCDQHPSISIRIHILKISHGTGITIIGNSMGKGWRRANCLLQENHSEA